MYVLCLNLGMGKVTSDPTLFVLVGLVFFKQSSTLFQLMKGSVDITWHLPKEIARAFHLDAGVGACNILATSWRTCIKVETRMGQVTQSYTDSCPVCIVSKFKGTLAWLNRRFILISTWRGYDILSCLLGILKTSYAQARWERYLVARGIFCCCDWMMFVVRIYKIKRSQLVWPGTSTNCNIL